MAAQIIISLTGQDINMNLMVDDEAEKAEAVLAQFLVREIEHLLSAPALQWVASAAFDPTEFAVVDDGQFIRNVKIADMLEAALIALIEKEEEEATDATA